VFRVDSQVTGNTRSTLIRFEPTGLITTGCHKENQMSTKKQLTPEQVAILNLMVSGAFSSIAVHAVGDRVAHGIHKVADVSSGQPTRPLTVRHHASSLPCQSPRSVEPVHGPFTKKTAEAPASL